MPSPFHQPRSRAEAIAAPLEAVRLAAAEDRAYLYGLAQIVADLLAPPEAKPAEGDDVRSAWKNAIQTRSHHA